jgi:hypothetical protein
VGEGETERGMRETDGLGERADREMRGRREPRER